MKKVTFCGIVKIKDEDGNNTEDYIKTWDGVKLVNIKFMYIFRYLSEDNYRQIQRILETCNSFELYYIKKLTIDLLKRIKDNFKNHKYSTSILTHIPSSNIPFQYYESCRVLLLHIDSIM